MSKRRKHKPEEIVRKLQEAEAMLKNGQSLSHVVQRLGVSEGTYHRWRSEYEGMGRDQVRRLKELEKENQRLKSAVADLTLDNLMLKEVVEGKP